MSSLSDRLAALNRLSSPPSPDTAETSDAAETVVAKRRAEVPIDTPSTEATPSSAHAAPPGATAGSTQKPGNESSGAGGSGGNKAPQPTPKSVARSDAAKDRFEDLKESVHTELLQQLGPQLYDANLDAAELESKVRAVLADVLAASNRPLTRLDRERITQDISDDILGYGPLEPYLRDVDVAEVMVNGRSTSTSSSRASWSRSTGSSRTRPTCAARSTRSSPGSGDGSTSPLPWSTRDFLTAAG